MGATMSAPTTGWVRILAHEDHVRPGPGGGVQPGPPIIGHHHLPPLELEQGDEEVADRSVVVDDQYAHAATAVSGGDPMVPANGARSRNPGDFPGSRRRGPALPGAVASSRP